MGLTKYLLQCLAVTSSKASNNNVMMLELVNASNLGFEFDGQCAHMHCFLYILNPSVKGQIY